MIESHIDTGQLRKKIEELMNYRLFPSLMAESNVSDDIKSSFYEHLIQLQTAIYYLDGHLEANWNIDPKIMNIHWDNICRQMLLFGINASKNETYLSHIKKYEKHELELRSGKSPLRFDMEYFYFYKSCDVKLLRRLIYEKLDLPEACGRLADWRYYDLITEVNDDIEDLEEDINFINGNSFLISLLCQGRKHTMQKFVVFMDDIALKANQKFKVSQGKFSTIIFDQTMQRIAETKHLMYDVLGRVSDEKISTSKLLHHQKIHLV
jgi:hypothetical protein